MANKKLNHSLMLKVLRITKSDAGRRYLPGQMDGFPSVPIQSLLLSVDGLARNEEFWRRVHDMQRLLTATAESNPLIAKAIAVPQDMAKALSIYRGLVRTFQAVLFQTISHRHDFGPIQYAIRAPRSRIERAFALVSESIANQKNQLKSDSETQSAERTRKELELDKFEQRNRKIYDALWEVLDFVQSEAFTLCSKPIALLTGLAGTGKTHFLCDIAEQRLRYKRPTLVFLARNVRHIDSDLIASIAASLPTPLRKDQLLKSCRRLSEAANERVLILIDAINEADRDTWKRLIEHYLDTRQAPHEVGFVLSCRTPYQNGILTKARMSQTVQLNHPGFSGSEYLAQKVIFKAYDLSLPEIPLLSNEFANPLFLISFCESIVSTTVRNQHKQIKEISSGQKGMTKVLEDFLKVKQQEITQNVERLGYTSVFRSSAWLWGKGLRAGIAKEIAEKMARRPQRYVLLDEFKDTVESYVTSHDAVECVVQQLFIGGVFLKTTSWVGNTAKDAVEFNYQKFSDHLIARSVLDDVDKDDESAIRDLYMSFIADPGILEALMIEYPVRSGKEMLAVLPQASVTITAMRSFISGLCWRAPTSFNDQTHELIFKGLRWQECTDELLEALVSLSLKKDHPCNSDWLHRYLRGFELTERDLHWSEYLRRCEKSSAPEKLIDWILERDVSKLSWDVVRHYVAIIVWILTTTRRRLRDLATKALVHIGVVFPQHIVETTIASLQINDPYIPERMLAALYGVWLRKLPYLKDKDCPEVQILREAVQSIYTAMFLPSSHYGTTHALARDYARRLILCSLEIDPALLSSYQQKRIKPPFSYGGIRKWGRSKDKDKREYRDGNAPIHSDFERYTLSHLYDQFSSDFEPEEAKLVEEQILWRLYSLGFEFSRFRQVDAEIARLQYWTGWQHKGKIDRYGKKYCWIAFFELYGYRQDTMRLEIPDDDKPRPSDCDIDPSFPEQPHKRIVRIRNYLGSRRITTKHWVSKQRIPPMEGLLTCDDLLGNKGRWVLLSGFFSQENVELGRYFHVTINSRLIEQRNIANLRTLLGRRNTDSEAFLGTPHTTYTFAGEIPWASTWPVAKNNAIEFDCGWETVRTETEEFVMYKGGMRLKSEERDEILSSFLSTNQANPSSANFEKHCRKNMLELRCETVTEQVRHTKQARISALNPVHEFMWESYHSDVNEGITIALPCRELCDALGLRMLTPTWDFKDPSGQRAVIVVKASESCQEQRGCYIREDVIQEYLSSNDYRLVWSLSGEKRRSYKDTEGHFREPDPSENIRKEFLRSFYLDSGHCIPL